MANPRKNAPVQTAPVPAVAAAAPAGSRDNPLPDQTAIASGQTATKAADKARGPAHTIGQVTLGEDGRKYKTWHLLPKLPANVSAAWDKVDAIKKQLAIAESEAQGLTVTLFKTTANPDWHLPEGHDVAFGESKREKKVQVLFAPIGTTTASRTADDSTEVSW